MTITSSLFFARRLVFPRTGRCSTARKSLLGAMLCIGISLVPLIAVISVSNGMIQGMTQRIIGLSSSHLEAFLPRLSDEASSPGNLRKCAAQLAETEGITAAYPEVNASAFAAGKSYRTGVRIRAVDPSIFSENVSFSTLLAVTDGSVSAFRSGTRTAVVGQKTAQLLGIKAGDMFCIITAAGTDDAVIPRTAVFRAV